MVKLCYSDPEIAFSNGLEYFNQEEETIYICEVSYPSGTEYHLKKTIIPGQECTAVFPLNEEHKFKRFDKAMKALSYFKAMGKRLCVKKQFEEDHGYKFVKYYYLCSM